MKTGKTLTILLPEKSTRERTQSTTGQLALSQLLERLHTTSLWNTPPNTQRTKGQSTTISMDLQRAVHA